MKNFIRINITQKHVLDQVSLAVKSRTYWIWLFIPEEFTNFKILEDILSIAKGETEVWIDTKKTAPFKSYADGFIVTEKPSETETPWATIAHSLSDLKNKELTNPAFILIHTNEFNKETKEILGSEGLVDQFPNNQYGWNIMTINIPVLVYGRLSKNEKNSLEKSNLFDGFEIS